MIISGLSIRAETELLGINSILELDQETQTISYKHI